MPRTTVSDTVSALDFAANYSLDFANSVARTAVHELGHQVGVATTTDGHRGDEPNNIMFGGGTSRVPEDQFYFAPEDIAYLRSAYQSPGVDRA